MDEIVEKLVKNGVIMTIGKDVFGGYVRIDFEKRPYCRRKVFRKDEITGKNGLVEQNITDELESFLKEISKND